MTRAEEDVEAGDCPVAMHAMRENGVEAPMAKTCVHARGATVLGARDGIRLGVRTLPYDTGGPSPAAQQYGACHLLSTAVHCDRRDVQVSVNTLSGRKALQG